MLDGTMLSVLSVARSTSGLPTVVLATGSTHYEGILVEGSAAACGRSHAFADGDVVMLGADQRASGDLLLKQLSCACTALLYAVWDWPTGRRE